MTVAWRIAQREYWSTAFDGIGSKIAGSRWNSIGIPAVFLADTLALAQLETLVHIPRKRLSELDVGIALVEFDEHLVVHVTDKDLPLDWRESPWPQNTQKLGDDWLQKRSSPILRLPSAVSPTDFNYLINPLHADFRKITIGPFHPFTFDSRLAK